MEDVHLFLFVKGLKHLANTFTQSTYLPKSVAVGHADSCALNCFAVTTAQTRLSDMLSNTGTQRLGGSYLHS